MSVTRYPLVEDADGRTTVDLGENATEMTALRMAPAETETLLRSGRWLVLGFAVWSGPDREAIEVAISASKRLGSARVAVRPFDDHAEFAVWCPGAPQTTRSPIWLLLRDGEFVASRIGTAAVDEIVSFVERTDE